MSKVITCPISLVWLMTFKFMIYIIIEQPGKSYSYLL